MTEEQFTALAPFEQHYRTALDCNYTRYPGRAAIDTMFEIFRAVTGSRININRSCSVCILHLVQNVGKLYFKEKERRESEALKDEKPVEEKEEPKPNKAKKTPRKKTAE